MSTRESEICCPAHSPPCPSSCLPRGRFHHVRPMPRKTGLIKSERKSRPDKRQRPRDHSVPKSLLEKKIELCSLELSGGVDDHVLAVLHGRLRFGPHTGHLPTHIYTEYPCLPHNLCATTRLTTPRLTIHWPPTYAPLPTLEHVPLSPASPWPVRWPPSLC